MSTTKILLIGANHHNVLGVIESLAQKNIKPYVIVRSDVKEQYVLYSHNIQKGWLCVSDERMLDIILSNFANKNFKTLIYSCDDSVTCFLDRNYKLLKDDFFLPISSKIGEMEHLMNKQNMSTLAFKVGLDVPKSWVTNDSRIPHDIQYPCITKAISSIKGSKDNISICYNEADLLSFLETEHCDTIQIQSFIDKSFEFQFLGFSFDAGNEVLITGRTHIDRPNGIDNTFFLSFDKVESEFFGTISKVKEFIKETQYNGPFSVEFLKARDGKDYFTEMNFRNDGNAFCQTCAGINVPYIAYLYYSKQDYKKEIENSEVHKVFMVPEMAYLRRVWAHEIDLKDYCKALKTADCYTTFFKQEKKLFFIFLSQEFKGILKNKTRNLFRKLF